MKLRAATAQLLSLSKTILQHYFQSKQQNAAMSDLEKLVVMNLQCLTNWTRLRSSVTVRVLFEHQLFDALFDVIQQTPALFSAGVDLLLEVLSISPAAPHIVSGATLAATSLHLSAPPEVIAHVFTRIAALRPLYLAAAGKQGMEHLAVCRSASQLIVGVGELNSPILASGIANNPIVKEYLAFALDCTGHPSKEVSELCLGFWSSLATDIKQKQEVRFLQSHFN